MATLTHEVCSVRDCSRPSKTRGWCVLHYSRWRRYGDPLEIKHRTHCSIEGCNRKHLARGLCSLHYQRANRHVGRNSHLRHKFGISLAEYEEMLANQGGGCAICGAMPNGKHLDVDHDHQTGKVRGIVCNDCNVAMGKMGDDPLRLVAAAKYLERA